jgi:hypothetical protein
MLSGSAVLCCAIALFAGPLSGGVKLTVIEGRPVVDGVYVNGHGPFRFLVDTATTLNHMEPRLGQSIGLTANFRTELTSSVGTILASGRRGTEIVLGAAQADNQTFLFAGMEAVHQLSSGIQGILGQEFLSRFDYRLDLHGKQLEFGHQDGSGKHAQLRMLDGRAAVSTNLGDLILDSGTAALILFGIKADRGETSYLRTIAGGQIVGMAYSRLLIEGSRMWSGQAVALPNRTEPGVAGLMPVNLFRSVYICNSERYAIFE